MASSLITDRVRRVPQQDRSRDKVRRVLDAADELLAREGAAALVTTRVAEQAGIAVGSVYSYFPDKEAIAEALALRYWSSVTDSIAAVAEADVRKPLADPVAVVLYTVAAGFRGSAGFRALWFSPLRSDRVRDATRALRTEAGASVERLLAVHWPHAAAGERLIAARMLVLAGDGLLREAFRLDPEGDSTVLDEGYAMLAAYLAARLGEPQPTTS
jgi:AcrR family transcriptional regulator